MAHLPNPKEGHPDIEPVGSPRRVCIDGGGTWDAATKTCTPKEERKEVAPQQVPKGSQVFITTPEGKRVIQTPETLAAAQRDIDILGVGVGAKQLIEEQEAQRLIEAEKQAILAQPSPTISLQPPELGATTVPLIGGIARAFALQAFDFATDADDTSLDPIRKNLGIMTSEEINALNISAIQKKELEKGLSASENVGALIEAIPGAKWLNKWLDIETPRGNLEEVIQNIKAMKRPILKYGADVRSDYMSKETATLKLDAAEQYVISQQARLRQLILNSPSLEFNSDRVNGFEVDILIVFEAIQQARIDTAGGKITDPTELQIFQQAQFQTTKEWTTSDW